MKVNKIFITIDFDWVSGIFDYPQNMPLPKVGERILFDTYYSRGCHAGEVYEVRHNISGKVGTITIKVKRD